MVHGRAMNPVLEAWAAQAAAAHAGINTALSTTPSMSASVTTGAPIWELIKVIAESIIEVMLISAVGYVLARRGVIDKRTQTKINKLNVSFFTPALLFSKVAFTLNPARLAELYIVPIGFVVITIVSAIVAVILAKVARLSKAQRNFTIACAISPNSNSLPVALMQSLVVTVPQLRWHEIGQPKDTKDSMLGRALTYLVLFSTLNQFLRWSIGAKLMSSVEEASYDDVEVGEDGVFDESGHYRDNPEQERLIHFDERDHDQQQQPADVSDSNAPAIKVRCATNDPAAAPASSKARAGEGRLDARNPAWVRSFPNSPDDETDTPLNEQQAGGAPSPPQWYCAQTLIWQPLAAMNRFMTMPLWAAILSLIVALIGPLQKFVDSLEPVVGALQTSGACSIPLTMVVLGSYFYEDKAAVDALKKQDDAAAAVREAETAQGAAMQGATRDANGLDPSLGTLRSGASTLVDNASSSKRRSLPWVKNPWNSASSSSGPSSAPASDSGSHGPSEAGDDTASSVGTVPVASDGGNGPEGAHAQEAWAKLAERNAARNSRNGMFPPVSAAGSASASSRSTPKAWREAAKQKKIRTMERRTIIVAVASRMIVTPLVLIPAAAWYAVATRYNVMDDPVFITCACLLIGSPPALTLAQITSQNAAGNSGFERLISKTIFVSYAFLAAPTTIALVLAALLIAQYDH